MTTCIPALLATLLLAGCASRESAVRGVRAFDFRQDTFAYANELVWEYYFDENGKWTHRRREPEPDYTHHCFVVARSSKQFFEHARFDPTAPPADETTYRRLVRRVVSISPKKDLPAKKEIVIPGYANLRAFSQEHASLLKDECGSFWQSYFQRGHWRAIWPFSRRHQERTTRQLADAIHQYRPPVVHLIRFPSLKINHAIVLFDARETETGIEFSAYDPNAPDKPVVLTYDRGTRRFSYPANFYFPGGFVNVYQIYTGWLY